MNFPKMSQSFIKTSLISILVAMMCVGLSTRVMALDPVEIKVVDLADNSTINATPDSDVNIYVRLNNVESYTNPETGSTIQAIQFVFTYPADVLEIQYTEEAGQYIPAVTVFDVTAGNGNLLPWPVYASFVDNTPGNPIQIALGMNPVDAGWEEWDDSFYESDDNIPWPPDPDNPWPVNPGEIFYLMASGKIVEISAHVKSDAELGDYSLDIEEILQEEISPAENIVPLAILNEYESDPIPYNDPLPGTLRIECDVVISNVEATNITADSATISWDTNIETDENYVEYGTDPQDLTRVDGTPGGTHHEVVLAGLDADTTYYYKITSNCTTDDNNGELYEFTIAPLKIYITSLPLAGYQADCAPIEFSICQDGNVIFEETKIVQFPVDTDNRVELLVDHALDGAVVDVIAKNWHYLATAAEGVTITDGVEVEIPEAKGGDANNDNQTNFFGDVLILAGQFNLPNERPCDYLPEDGAPPEPWHADFNQDGSVNFFGDVLILAGNYNQQGFTCGSAAPSIVYPEGSNSSAVFQLLVNGVPSNNSGLSVGEDFEVAIRAQNVSDLYGYSLRLNYDVNGLMLLKSTKMAAAEGVFLRNTTDNPSLFFATEKEIGLSKQITIIGSMTGNANGITGSGVVANLRFRVISDTPGTISLNNVEVAEVNSGYNLLPQQQLIIQAVPKTTAALQNYPNPFNPETWIPFHLANDALVTIKIYDLSGRLIRRIDIGQKAAGYHVSQSQAAYWNGRNEYGEPVSSGVYFYTIQAGNYTATRKMMMLK